MRYCLVFLIFLFLDRASARDLTPLDPAELEMRLDELTHFPLVQTLKEKKLNSVGYCERFDIDVPYKHRDGTEFFTKTFTVLTPDFHKKKPVLIFIPTIVGVTVEKKMAQSLCARGIAAVFAHVNTDLEPDVIPGWGFEDETNQHAVLSLRTLLDYLQSSDHFDPNHIGILGSSLGGFATVLLSGLENSRIKAMITIVAGGNAPEILSTSQQKRPVELRKKRMKWMKTESVDEYEEILHQTIRQDAIYLAPRIDREKILMVISDNDTSVPTKNQWDLYQALGQPEKRVYSLSHAASVVYAATIDFAKIIDFFKDRLKTQN